MCRRTPLGNPVANRPRARPCCRMAHRPQRSSMHVSDNVCHAPRHGRGWASLEAQFQRCSTHSARFRCAEISDLHATLGRSATKCQRTAPRGPCFPNVDLHISCLFWLRNMAPTPPTVRVVHTEQTKKCAKKFAASGASPPDRHRCTPQTCTAETATCRSSATIKGFGRSLTEGNRRKNINFHAFTRGLSLSLPSRVGKR